MTILVIIDGCAQRGDDRVRITRQEERLLAAFVTAPRGRVMLREELYERLFPHRVHHPEGAPVHLRVVIRRLRLKLGRLGVRFTSVRDQGYTMTLDEMENAT